MHSRQVGTHEPSLGELISDLSELRSAYQADLADLGRLKVAEDVTEDWVQLPFRFVSMPAGSTAIVTRTISGDGPFDLIEITFTGLTAAGVATSAFRIRIKEGEAVGRTLTQDGEFIDIDNTAGTAQRPYIIKGRRRFRGNIAIMVEATNTGAAIATLEVALHGPKIFTR